MDKSREELRYHPTDDFLAIYIIKMPPDRLKGIPTKSGSKGRKTWA